MTEKEILNLLIQSNFELSMREYNNEKQEYHYIDLIGYVNKEREFRFVYKLVEEPTLPFGWASAKSLYKHCEYKNEIGVWVKFNIDNKEQPNA